MNVECLPRVCIRRYIYLYTMAYNLQRRSIRAVIAEEENANYGEDALSSEESHISEDSYESDSECSESSNNEMDIGFEDDNLQSGTVDQRILISRARDRPTSILREKNDFNWNTVGPIRRSDRIDEEVNIIPSPKGKARNCNSPFEFWQLLFDADMVNLIVKHTNAKIEDVYATMGNDKHKQTYHHLTDNSEIMAFIGLLYYSGLWKLNHVDTCELWNKENGLSFYGCVMLRQRFEFLCSCLRFDDKKTRDPEDRLASIKELWTKFINNCTRFYEPSNWCTVDEQLLEFRGRCRFKMYMPKKPDKYGLKIITLNDAKTFYLINGIPYLGKTNTRTTEAIPEFYFKEVTTPIHNTNRSVTANNWFMSIPLMEKMKDEPYKIRMTGTICKNKREIPAEMKVSGKEVPSSKFVFHNDIILVAHTLKKNKIVLLTSNYIQSANIGEKNKPIAILHYDKTKSCTDTFNQLCHAYTTSRKTLRWPLRFFFGILDQAQVNARILYVCKLKNAQEHVYPNTLTAVNCLKGIVKKLCQQHLIDRYETATIRTDIKRGIAEILRLRDRNVNNQERLQFNKQRRCTLCENKKDCKTKMQCPSCLRAMCDNHRTYLCLDCGELE